MVYWGLMDSNAGPGLRAETIRLASTSGARGAERTLVALGDSITYGWGLPYALSYPALLGKQLNEGGREPKPWRVINAGVSGDTVLCAEQRYERDVSLWQADVLIIALGLNDAALRRTRFDRQRERLWLAYRNAWVRWSLRLDRALALLGMKRAGRARSRAGGPWETEERRGEPRVQPDLYARAMEELVRRAQAQGSLVYLLSLPLLAWERVATDQAAWYRRYDGLIRQVASATGVAVIDVGAAPDMGPGAGYWQDDGIHPSAKGQAWLARCIGDRLERDGQGRSSRS